MTRSRGAAPASRCCWLLVLISAGLLTIIEAGPLPNVTLTDIGLKEGSCALGDVVYMPGDEFPGPSACERCTCARGSVSCARQVCEPRPGCKALHRPDHCCPTYQCECEQEGRVYGNGEKLVDPADPCRVCYCQGGEVVCRRIACFVRDDCRPRHVPGRCCPEYDNCPLRGVTAVPGLSATMSAIVEDVGISPQPQKPKENVKQQITIKEITPVSEIPVITDVKIKEILPSPSINIAEYPSSKAPLITREATSEKTYTSVTPRTDLPTIVEIKPSPAPVPISSTVYSIASTKLNEALSKLKPTSEPKINILTTQPASSESPKSSVPSTKTPPDTQQVVFEVSTSVPPVMEEEDLSVFDHNPAFPPLPDDFPVLGNHEEEMVSENMYGEHISSHDPIKITSVPPPTENPTTAYISTNSITSSSSSIDTASTPAVVSTTEKIKDSSNVAMTTVKVELPTKTEAPILKESPMLNLRSAIPTEILNVPSVVSQDITGELDEITEMPSTTAPPTEKEVIYESTIPEEIKTTVIPLNKENTAKVVDLTEFQVLGKTKASSEQPSFPTDVTSLTELSSLPIETSDQNPQESLVNIVKEQNISSSTKLRTEEYTTKSIQYKTELPTTSSLITSPSQLNTELNSVENGETTEFALESFGSSESVTDGVELIKGTSETEKSASFIKPTHQTRNVLKELINLVGDVANINDHTEETETLHKAPAVSDYSEELLPVNAGYKSKNNNWNINSITEMPGKSKTTVGNKQKVIEIEGEDTDSITDSPPPNDKVEPTTRRAVIDNVSDDFSKNKTDKKDIEIISQSYVPTINKRPTKVILKKKIEQSAAGQPAPESTTLTPTTITPQPSTTPAATTTTPPAASTTTPAAPKTTPATTTTTPAATTNTPVPTTTTPAPTTTTPAASTTTPAATTTTAAATTTTPAASTTTPVPNTTTPAAPTTTTAAPTTSSASPITTPASPVSTSPPRTTSPSAITESTDTAPATLQ